MSELDEADVGGLRPPPEAEGLIEPETTGLLTERDVDLLAEAIRRGRASGPDPGVRKRVAWTLAVGVVVLVVELALIDWLLSSRPAQRLSATTTDVSALHAIGLAAPDGDGRWSVSPALAKTIAVRDTRSDIEMYLPLPRDGCDRVADRLGTRCSDGSIELLPPFDISASRRVRLAASGDSVTRLDLGLALDRPRSPSSVSISASGDTTTRVCISPPEKATRLTVALATGGHADLDVGPDRGALLRCEDGIRLMMRPASDQGAVSTLVLGDVGAVALSANGTRADVSSFGGKVALVDVKTLVFDPAEHLLVTASRSTALGLQVSLGSGDPRASLSSPSVSGVVTDGGEALPTRWELRSALWTPLTGLLGAIALGLLQVGVRGAMSWAFEGKPSLV